MSLMINQNITSLNAWRNLSNTNRMMSSTMEKLSSGLRINRAADDPSGLVVSEQMRAQVVGLKAAVKNSEKGISMIQTAEASLDKVHTLLDQMRALALDSANNATNDANMLAANQAEIQNAIETISRIASNTQYGTKKLLDGTNNNNSVVSSAGTTGLTSGNVEASTLATGNHSLVITAATAASTVIGSGTGVALSSTPDNTLSAGTHTLTVSGTLDTATVDNTGTTTGTSNAAMHADSYYSGSADTTYTFTFAGSGTIGTDATTINWTSSTGGSGSIALAADYNTTDALSVEQGLSFTLGAGTFVATESFTVAATASTVSATLDNGPAVSAHSGNTDLTLTSGNGGGGSIDLDFSSYSGAGTVSIAETKATYNGVLDGGDAVNFQASQNNVSFTTGAATGGALTLNFGSTVTAGTAVFANTDSSLVFQIGANQNQTVKIGIRDVSAEQLAKGVTNTSGFTSLAQIDVTTSQGAQDAIALIDKAIDQVSTIRGDLGAFQKNTLEANLDNLRVAAENLQASEAVIRDTDMAAEMATFTKYQIMMQAGTAMLAQANQIPNNILQLLR
ncbi:MAG: flagellin [Thermodesulfobacteriota bacterium]